MAPDLDGTEALDRMWVALRTAIDDPKERAAFAIYWASQWGIHYNDTQMAGRLAWWREDVQDGDVEHFDSEGLPQVTRGREYYRAMAAAAACALL